MQDNWITVAGFLQLHRYFKVTLSNCHLSVLVIFFRRIQEDEPTDEDDLAENDDNNDEDEDEYDPEDEYERFIFSL